MSLQIGQYAAKAATFLPALRFSSPAQMLTKAALVALPAIAMFSDAFVQRAEAGPIAYAACMAACSAATMGGFIPACIAACTPALAAPTP